MAENYIVNYQINVNSNPALESIRKFQQATAEMESLTKRFDIVAKSISATIILQLYSSFSLIFDFNLLSAQK